MAFGLFFLCFFFIPEKNIINSTWRPQDTYAQERPEPVFFFLLEVSSNYARSITGQVTEVTCPAIGRAQPELTPSKRQKMGLVRKNQMSVYVFGIPSWFSFGHSRYIYLLWLLVMPLFCIYRFQVNAFDIYNAQILNVASVVGFVIDLSSSKRWNKLICEIETYNICV